MFSYEMILCFLMTRFADKVKKVSEYLIKRYVKYNYDNVTKKIKEGVYNLLKK
jgi:hypothetical protein